MPVLRDRPVDGKAVSSAPHHWVEAQDQPPRGGAKNAKGAKLALQPFSHPQIPRDNITITTRNTTVICLTHSNKITATCTQNARQNREQITAIDQHSRPVAITERRETESVARRSRRQSSSYLDEARRKGLAHTYRAQVAQTYIAYKAQTYRKQNKSDILYVTSQNMRSLHSP